MPEVYEGSPGLCADPVQVSCALRSSTAERTAWEGDTCLSHPGSGHLSGAPTLIVPLIFGVLMGSYGSGDMGALESLRRILGIVPREHSFAFFGWARFHPEIQDLLVGGKFEKGRPPPRHDNYGLFLFPV